MQRPQAAGFLNFMTGDDAHLEKGEEADEHQTVVSL